MRILICVLAVFFASMAAQAQTTLAEHGGDTFVSGETVLRTLDASGDVFVAGRSATVLGQIEGDFHASGFGVVLEVDVAQDAYAAGATVTVKGTVGHDLTVAGFTVRTEPTSRVAGNARLAGSSVVIGGPVDGAVSAAGRDVLINAPISGDVRIVARTLRFGPDATVSGRLVYSTSEQIDIPDRVASANRVAFEPLTFDALRGEWTELREMPVFPTFASMFFGFLVTLLFYVVLGAIALGFFPRKLSWLRKSIAAAPGRTLMQGVFGLSMLFGAVPVTAMTIVGIPFLPIGILGIVVVWIFAYALGAYAVAMRMWIGFGGDPDPAIPARLAVFAAAIMVIALLNFIPFVGWVANYTLVLLGVGAFTHAVFVALIPDIDPAVGADLSPVDDASRTN